MLYPLVISTFFGLFGFICSYMLFALGRNYYSHRRFRKLLPQIPVAPNGSIFGGHMHLWCKMGNVKKISKCHEEMGKTFAYFINHRPVIITIDLDLIKKYAFDGKNDHIVRPAIMSPIKKFESDSLIMASGNQLTRLRQVYAAALSNHKIKSPYVLQQIRTSVNKLVDCFEWQLNQRGKYINNKLSVEIDLDELVSRYTVDLVFSTLHKQDNLVDFKSESVKLVQGSFRATKIFLDIDQTLAVTFYLCNYLVYELSKISERILHYFIAEFDRCVTETVKLNMEARKQYIEEKETKSKMTGELGGEFTKATKYIMKDGKVFNRGLIDFIIDKLYDKTITLKEYLNSTFFLHTAAERTSSDVIVHTILNLTLNEECQEKVRKSILVDGEKSQYLSWCILESIRLMPPVPGGPFRRLEHPITTNDGITLPKGTLITAPPYTLHRVKELWGEDAEEFNPDRWVNEKNFSPQQFLGFGAGKRYCLGKEYAMTHMKMLLVSLLSKFKFEPSSKTEHDKNFGSPFYVFLVAEKHSHVMLKYIRNQNDQS